MSADHIPENCHVELCRLCEPIFAAREKAAAAAAALVKVPMPAKLGAIPKTAGGDGAPNKGRTGRPTKLTPELSAKVADAIRAGNFMETAAALAGVSKDSLYEWLRRGAQPRGTKGCRQIHRDFADAVNRAQAEAEKSSLDKIRGSTEWQAHAWYLERTRRRSFGRNVMELGGVDGGPVKVELEGGNLLDTLRRLVGDRVTGDDVKAAGAAVDAPAPSAPRPIE